MYDCVILLNSAQLACVLKLVNTFDVIKHLLSFFLHVTFSEE